MRNYGFAMIFALIAGLFVTGVAAAQGSNSFSSPNVDYVFSLPDQRWKQTVKPSSTASNVEYVYGDRTDGHLEVRRLKLPPSGILSDLIKEEEEKLQFLQSFIAGKNEQFSGSLSGEVYNYEYVRSGRPMSGRFYFLKAGDNSVYVLRFTGFRDNLRTIRNQTDAIARSFAIKKK
jgi:hypothetical protein